MPKQLYTLFSCFARALFKRPTAEEVAIMLPAAPALYAVFGSFSPSFVGIALGSLVSLVASIFLIRGKTTKKRLLDNYGKKHLTARLVCMFFLFLACNATTQIYGVQALAHKLIASESIEVVAAYATFRKGKVSSMDCNYKVAIYTPPNNKEASFCISEAAYIHLNTTIIEYAPLRPPIDVNALVEQSIFGKSFTLVGLAAPGSSGVEDPIRDMLKRGRERQTEFPSKAGE